MTIAAALATAMSLVAVPGLDTRAAAAPIGPGEPSAASGSTSTKTATSATAARKAAGQSAGGTVAEGAGAPRWARRIAKAKRPTVSTLLGKLDAAPIRELVAVRNIAGRPSIELIRLGDRTSARATIERTLRDPSVLSVSPPVAVRVQQAQPDPLLGKQWAMKSLGAQNIWGKHRADGVTVAVVDTGVQAAHPDLAGVVVPGRDLLENLPLDATNSTDPHGHGTHVAGVIAALAHNGIGGAGLAQGAQVMPVRVLDARGGGTDAMLAQGVIWAVDNGAQVINLSVGAPAYSAAEDAAIAYALDHDVVVVAAAGNYRGFGDPVVYPAAFPGVIGVAASTKKGRIATFSSTGAGVDIAAPGIDILSTVSPDSYGASDGTSMAAPFVTATAALVRAAAPRLRATGVARSITFSALDIGARGPDATSGAGLLRPAEAIAAARPTRRGAPSPSGANSTATALRSVGMPTRVRFGAKVRVRFRLLNGARALSGAQVEVCHSARPEPAPRCVRVTTDARGLASTAIMIAGPTRVWARYRGSGGYDASTSRHLSLRALPVLRLKATAEALVLDVRPRGHRQWILVERRTASGWVFVSRRPLPSSGPGVIRGLARGAVYRVRVPATTRTLAAVSSAILFR